jgi:hypothetical protein
VALIQRVFPNRGVAYDIEVTIIETENNLFIVDRHVTV